MDVHCRICGEPWDQFEFHAVAEDMGSTYREVSADFRKRGCVALGASQCIPVDCDRTVLAGVVYDLLGDDIDGAAALLEDMIAGSDSLVEDYLGGVDSGF